LKYFKTLQLYDQSIILARTKYKLDITEPKANKLN